MVRPPAKEGRLGRPASASDSIRLQRNPCPRLRAESQLLYDHVDPADLFATNPRQAWSHPADVADYGMLPPADPPAGWRAQEPPPRRRHPQHAPSRREYADGDGGEPFAAPSPSRHGGWSREDGRVGRDEDLRQHLQPPPEYRSDVRSEPYGDGRGGGPGVVMPPISSPHVRVFVMHGWVFGCFALTHGRCNAHRNPPMLDDRPPASDPPQRPQHASLASAGRRHQTRWSGFLRRRQVVTAAGGTATRFATQTLPWRSSRLGTVPSRRRLRHGVRGGQPTKASRWSCQRTARGLGSRSGDKYAPLLTYIRVDFHAFGRGFVSSPCNEHVVIQTRCSWSVSVSIPGAFATHVGPATGRLMEST